MSVLVVGKNGFLAKKLAPCLNPRSRVLYTSSREVSHDTLSLDLLKPKEFDYGAIDSSTRVVLLAAISSPDLCANKYDLAYAVNVSGTAYFIEQCLARKAKVLFFSSDTVFGECAVQVDETSDVNPIGPYANMKRVVESRFAGEIDFKTLRLSYVFSREDKFTSYLHKCALSEVEAEIFRPILRRVVYLNDVLGAIKALCESWSVVDAQVINACGPDLLSREDIATMYQEEVNAALRLKISEPTEAFFAARPKCINMGSGVFSRVIGYEPTAIRQAMRREFPQNRGR